MPSETRVPWSLSLRVEGHSLVTEVALSGEGIGARHLSPAWLALFCPSGFFPCTRNHLVLLTWPQSRGSCLARFN